MELQLTQEATLKSSGEENPTSGNNFRQDI